MPKYRFLTVIHNLEPSILNDIKVNSIGIISTDKEILNKTFANNLSIGTIGVHSIDEFDNTVFFYADGEFKEKSNEQIDRIGTHFTFYILRLIQSYVFDLWKIKDNNLYIRDGFLYVYNKEIADGVTYKASVSAIYTLSNLENKRTVFTSEELNRATKDFKINEINDFYSDSFNYKDPTYDHFFKHSKSSRIERSWYFINMARNNGTIPMKLVSYCTALECLFTNSRTELVHRISERVAILLEENPVKRLKTYNLVKKAYDIRSTIVHGSILKGTNENILEISIGLDKILRKLIIGEYGIFSKNDNEINQYFMDKLFEP